MYSTLADRPASSTLEPTPAEVFRSLLSQYRGEILTIAERRRVDNVRVIGSVARGDARGALVGVEPAQVEHHLTVVARIERTGLEFDSDVAALRDVVEEQVEEEVATVNGHALLALDEGETDTGCPHDKYRSDRICTHKTDRP